MNKRIFITGGAGFIGSHLVDELIAENSVVIYDNFSRDSLKYTSLGGHPNLRVIEGDILDVARLTESMQGADICIHAAAIAGIYSVGKKPIQTMNVNLIGTHNTIEAAVKHQVERFVDFSTSEVYGPFVYKGKESDSCTLGPVGDWRWVYAVSKLASEHMLHTYAQEYAIDVVTIRPFNVYGPRQIGEGAIQQMTLNALKGQDLTLYNDGTQIRSWCYISDFIRGLSEAIFGENAKNQVFNIGNPQATTTILGLAERIIALTNSKSKIVFKKHPGPEVELRIPDITKAATLLSYQPVIDLTCGLTKTITWFKEHLEQL